jgi:elongation factor Ts
MAYVPSIGDVKKLREMTLASVALCRQCLVESQGDVEKAAKLLEQKGAVKAASKTERATGFGMVEAYIHAGGRIGAMVELRCETDFVALNETFKKLAHELCLQIAAMNPQWVDPEHVPPEILEERRAMIEAELLGTKKPTEIVEKIIAGKLDSFFQETCLTEQPYIRDDTKRVKDCIVAAIATLGENIKVQAFTRFAI